MRKHTTAEISKSEQIRNSKPKTGQMGVTGELWFLRGHVVKNPDFPGKSGTGGHVIRTDVRCLQRAVDGWLLRPADRQTAAGGDEDVEPDGGRLSDERQRVHDQSRRHPRHLVELVAVDARVREQLRRGEVEEEDQQEKVVGDRQRSEEELGNRMHVAVPAQDHVGDRVAGQSEQT